MRKNHLNKKSADNDIQKLLDEDDSSALDMIWNHYASDLLGYLVNLLCSRHDAEDALQETFVTIARKRSSVAKARRLKPYLFRLSRNVALNQIKKSTRRKERETQEMAWLIPNTDSEQSAERTLRLEAALASLPEKQRAVLVLKFYRDKTFREIGEILGVSENTAGSRYRYGMEKLRYNLQELKDESTN